MEQNGACFVFCGEMKAKELLASKLVQELANLFRTGIEYQTGAFVIQRRDLSAPMQQKCKQSLIHLVNTYTPTPAAGQWFWFNGRSFCPYDPASSAAIEEAYQAHHRYLILAIRGKPYQVDLAQWRQTDLTSHMSRAILRSPMPTAGTHWGYWSEGQFVPLTPENSQILNQAVQAQKPFATIHVDDSELRADVTRLTLRDEGRKREYKLGYQ